MPGGEDGYEYLIGMRDEMSAQSKAITAALNEMTSALGHSGSKLKEHAADHLKAAHALKEHEGVLKGFLGTLARSAAGGGIGGGLVGDIAKGTLLAHGVEKMGDLVGESVRFAVEASEFKENTIAAYTIVKGTAEEGEKTFAELDKTAREIHMPAERAHAMAQSLMLEGLESQKAITDTVRAVGALQSVGLEAGASKLQSIVEKSISTGGLELGKGGKGLKGTGLTFDTIAAELGMGRKQFESELKAGKISAETGIEAIDQVILKGKVGALATKKFTMSDALTDMKNAIRGVFQESDSSPVTDAFKRMSEQFTETGEGAKDTKEAINGLIELGGGLIDLATGIGMGLVGAVNALKHALMGARDAAGWLLDKLHGVAGSATSIFQSAEDKRFSEQAEKDVDKRVDKALRKRIEERKIKEVEDFAATPGHTPKEIHALAKKLGVDMYAPGSEEAGGKAAKDEREMRAALRGVTGPGQVVEKFDTPPREDLHATGKEAGHSFEGGIRDALKMHSPSQVLFDVGEEAGVSLASGHKSAASMLRNEEPAAPQPSRSSKSVQVNVDMGGFHFQGQASADDFIPLLESQIADVFERAAIELGA